MKDNNRLIFALLVVFVFASATSSFAQTPVSVPVGLVSWWSGDGNALDARSRNNGTTFGGLAYAPSTVGPGFSFDGIDDFFDPGNPANLRFTGQDFTVEGWFRIPNVPNNAAGGCEASYPIIANTWGYNIEIDAVGRLHFYKYVTIGSLIGVRSPAPVALNVPQHFAAVHTATEMRLYINGSFVASQPITTGTVFYRPTFPLQVGRNFCGSGIFLFKGTIDELAIYGRALTVPEIESINNAGAAGKLKPAATNAPANLVGFWSGDGNAFDLAGANNGTLQDGAGFGVGRVGQSFDLDGTDDFVQLPSSPSFNFGTGDFSAEFWFRLDSTSGDQTLFHKSVGSFPNSQEYILETSNGNLRFMIRNTTANENDLNVPGVVSANTWYHLAAVRLGNTNSVYLNGVLAGQQTAGNNVDTGSGSAPVIGKLAAGALRFVNGQIDEFSLYNRALTVGEIQSIFNAGNAGKLKNVATNATTERRALWQAEGNANDFTGVNNGTLFNGASYTTGRIGRAFNFVRSSGQYVEIPDSPSLSPTTQITTAAWVRLAGDHDQSVIGKYGTSTVTVQNSFFHGFYSGRTFVFCVYATGYYCRIANSPVALNQWIHTAATFDTSTQEMKLFINGAEIPSTVSTTSSVPAINDSDTPLRISGNPEAYPDDFDGQVDDAALYGRVLSPAEIQAMYREGAGALGETTVTFANVTTAGTTEVTPTDASSLPPLPSGSTSTGLFFDISTTAVYSGSPRVCFSLPTISNPGVFANLKIAHIEGGAWINRTDLASIDFATRTICTAGLPSLSPFAIVNGFVPTAANASVSGRVRTSDGRGIANASVSIMNTSTGEIRHARTGTFGYYGFEGLPAGETYVLTVNSKRFVFVNPSRVITLDSNATDEDFIAESIAQVSSPSTKRR